MQLKHEVYTSERNHVDKASIAERETCGAKAERFLTKQTKLGKELELKEHAFILISSAPPVDKLQSRSIELQV